MFWPNHISESGSTVWVLPLGCTKHLCVLSSSSLQAVKAFQLGNPFVSVTKRQVLVIDFLVLNNCSQLTQLHIKSAQLGLYDEKHGFAVIKVACKPCLQGSTLLTVYRFHMQHKVTLACIRYFTALVATVKAPDPRLLSTCAWLLEEQVPQYY